MKSPILKVYGERNTGTNYLQKLIALNFDVVELRDSVPAFIGRLESLLQIKETLRNLYFDLTQDTNLGWKHSCVFSPQELYARGVHLRQVRFVTLTKNPYSWLLSLFQHPYHQRTPCHSDFETFLASPWHTVKRDNIYQNVLPNPIMLWNIKNASYQHLNGQFPVLNLRYEDLLANPEDTMEKMMERLGIQKKVALFQDYTESTKNDRGKDADYYRDYYLNEKWKERLSSQAISIINESIDPSLMETYHYEILT